MVSFTARRMKPELVTPARPTPHEYKAVSDIDDQRGFRFYPAVVEFFRDCHHTASASAADVVDVDPVSVIRAALAEALVSYYPLAGRLLELPAAQGGKLVVECTAEGVVFAEADADVRLEELGQPLIPPYPCVEELLCQGAGEPEGVVVSKPLLFFQVTRFKDNDGFAIGYRYCHSVVDGFGMAQLLDAVYTLARGEVTRFKDNDGFAIGYRYCHSVVDGFGMAQLLDAVYTLARSEALTRLPVWERELLTARAPPRITHEHTAYEPLPAASGAAADDIMRTTPLDDMVVRYFRFGPSELGAMRSQVPASLLRRATVFEIVTAAVWRCRTAALGYQPRQRVRLLIVSDARGCWKRGDAPPLPPGFYGSATVPQTAEAPAGELCGRPLGHSLEIVRAAKFGVSDEYMQSMVDLLAARGRPFYTVDCTYVMSDTTGLGRRAVKLGRWERAGGGIATAGRVATTSLQSYYERCKSGGGEECVVLSMCLRPAAMDRFARLIAALTHKSKATSAL